MKYTKIPRKLKKKMKKNVLSSFSDDYKKVMNRKSSNLRILYWDSNTERLGFVFV